MDLLQFNIPNLFGPGISFGYSDNQLNQKNVDKHYPRWIGHSQNLTPKYSQ
jgi:hypothetical protein